MNSVQLSIFASQIAAVADEMGAVLRRSAFSPNIRDRLDYSCALFNTNAELCAQAAHIPVHLGSMAYAMQSVVKSFEWQPGDAVIFNDPFLGGTHLPDVTLVSPAFIDERLIGFVANRAHHANIGAESPGSMPVSSSLEEEGMIIPPTLLLKNGEMVESVWSHILAGVGGAQQRGLEESFSSESVSKELSTEIRKDAPNEIEGDLLAQISANKKGLARMQSLANKVGLTDFSQGLDQLNHYGELLAKEVVLGIPNGEYFATDLMDDDGQGNLNIPLSLCARVEQDSIHFDFSGSSPQVLGNINCPLSVTAAAVYYVFRCLLPTYAPACAGTFRPISIEAPEGSMLHARRPAAVAAGNVETSSRVVDLVIAALAKAIPDQMPADSQGTMNNLAMGNNPVMETAASDDQSAWSYYETIAGGAGASSQKHGLSARHSHMTNTFNTPIEVLESNFPLRVTEYSIRRHSGGQGVTHGGDGVIREYEFLSDANVSLLTERRHNAPKGAAGGGNGAPGRNILDGEVCDPKSEFQVNKGSSLRIETPGGGGYGRADGVAENRSDD